MLDSSSKPLLVLLVDDDLRTARRMAEMLSEDGFAVEVARDGAAAISRLTRNPVPDVVVMELNLPHADGNTVAQFARTRRAEMQIIVVTGYPQLLKSTAFGFEPPLLFTKPVDYGSLRDVLQANKPPAKSVRVPDLQAPAKDLQLESSPTDASGNPISGAQKVRALQRA